MMKNLWLLRGLPHSGKNTVGAQLAGPYVYAADDWFENIARERSSTYDEVFDPSQLGQAHGYCKDQVRNGMFHQFSNIAVANTFTQLWEMKDYMEMAEEYGYRVHVLHVERAHEGQNDHTIPDEAIERMARRWQHVDSRFG